jgi:ribonuclease BN (tRNA processing enzyme)
MKVVFLGVGEACDESYPNTSLLLESRVAETRPSVLLDCGFTVPPLYFRRTRNPNELDALWISHFHGDHFFGVPILLLRFWETNRAKPLTIMGQTGVEDMIRQTMALAYPNFMSKLAFPLTFVEAEPNQCVHVAGLTWAFAENGHGRRDLAVRIDDGARSVFYSGDGRPTPETLSLAAGCDLIVHEAFHLDQSIPGHGTVEQCIDFGRNAGASSLALVHLQRDVRRERRSEVLDLIGKVRDLHVFLPEPGDEIEL